LRTTFAVIPLPRAWPVEVTYHEARAFCAWSGPAYRLPTEIEHAALRARAPVAVPNVGLRHKSPTPVAEHDTRGNVWEWVEDRARPLAGFAPHPLYPDFSTPGIAGQHRMILGNSWISSGAYGAATARSWFRDHFLQHVGFRLARSL
jgi:formylglycine-generating enzyme required for sulfatase activity